MLITIEYLESLDPCDDRLDNYKKHYSKDISLKKFLNLKKISHSDKLWVYFRSIPRNRIPLVAAEIAEKCPNDDRVRKTIEAARREYGATAWPYAESAVAMTAIWPADSAVTDRPEMEVRQIQIMKKWIID